MGQILAGGLREMLALRSVLTSLSDREVVHITNLNDSLHF